MDNKTDWYRKTTWTKEIEENFFSRLGRSRELNSKVQYLNIQASALVNTKKKVLIETSIKLFKKALDLEYPTFRSDAYFGSARAYVLLGKQAEALNFFQKVVQIEKFGNDILTEAGKEFAAYVVENSLSAHYDEALDAMEVRRIQHKLPFPDEHFVYYSVRAIIFDRRGEKDQVPAELNEAIKYFSLKKDIFVRHPGVGMIDPKRRKRLINLVKRLAKKYKISIGS